VVGERRARELLLTGEPISANKALLWGLVNDVVPYKELDAAVSALSRKLIEKFPQSLKHARQQIGFWKDLVWESNLERARNRLAAHFASEEAIEGMQALVERREIDYKGFRAKAARGDNRQSEIETCDGKSKTEKQTRHSATAARERPNGASLFCFSCGAQGLPASFEYCGRCGARLP
jgi:hypothetical protein